MRKHGKMFAAVLLGVALAFGSAAAFSPVPRTAKFLSRAVPTATTTDSTPITIGHFDVVPFDNSIMHAQVRVVAIELTTGKSKAFTVQGAFKRVNGVMDLVGNKIETEFETGDPITGAWDADVDFDDVTDQVYLTITGSDNMTIDWMADISIDLYQP